MARARPAGAQSAAATAISSAMFGENKRGQASGRKRTPREREEEPKGRGSVKKDMENGIEDTARKKSEGRGTDPRS